MKIDSFAQMIAQAKKVEKPLSVAVAMANESHLLEALKTAGEELPLEF